MKNVFAFLSFLMCLTPIASFAQKESFPDSKMAVKEERTLSSFETVVVRGGGRLRFYFAAVPSLELRGKDGCKESVDAEVRGNTLYIQSETEDDGNCQTEIYIRTPVLSEIHMNGGGRVQVEEGFPAVDSFHCHLQGGGEVLMYSLAVDSLFASIQGGGVIKARVKNLLHGKIDGGGLIRYMGAPVVVSGGGVIKKGK